MPVPERLRGPRHEGRRRCYVRLLDLNREVSRMSVLGGVIGFWGRAGRRGHPPDGTRAPRATILAEPGVAVRAGGLAALLYLAAGSTLKCAVDIRDLVGSVGGSGELSKDGLDLEPWSRVYV